MHVLESFHLTQLNTVRFDVIPDESSDRKNLARRILQREDMSKSSYCKSLAPKIRISALWQINTATNDNCKTWIRHIPYYPKSLGFLPLHLHSKLFVKKII